MEREAREASAGQVAKVRAGDSSLEAGVSLFLEALLRPIPYREDRGGSEVRVVEAGLVVPVALVAKVVPVDEGVMDSLGATREDAAGTGESEVMVARGAMGPREAAAVPVATPRGARFMWPAGRWS